MKNRNFFWTYNTYEAVWNHLAVLEYRENVKNLLIGRFSSNRRILYKDEIIAEKKAAQISFSIRQAHEYFRAADAVSINTNPMLYFYGILCLTKALIIANDYNLHLSSIKYHGLSQRSSSEDLKKYDAEDNAWSIENEYAVTNEGVFEHLTRQLHDCCIPKDSIIRFKSTLSTDPQLEKMFEKYYGEKSHVQYAYLHYNSDPFEIVIQPKTNDTTCFEKIFPEIARDFEIAKVDPNEPTYRNKANVTEVPPYIVHYCPPPGGQYLIGPTLYIHNSTQKSMYLHPCIADYLGMFILSNTVRYKQEFWGKLINGETAGTVGLVNLFLENVKLRFPIFILENLFGERFEYGAAARIS